MGWEMKEIRFMLTLDAHGGEKERRDEGLWAELKKEVATVVNQEKYESIRHYPLEFDDE